MPLIQATVSMPATSGITRDEVTNRFQFDTQGNSAAVGAGFAQNLLDEFYNDQVVGLGGPISSMLASTISRAQVSQITYHEFVLRGAPTPSGRWYDLNFVVQLPLTLFPAGEAPSLPQETAFRLTWHGQLTGSDSDARRRGGCFLGPFGRSHGTAVSGSPNRPTTDLGNVVRGAASRMLDNSVNGGTGLIPVAWVIVSPTQINEDESLANAASDVIAGWTDDEWDTQRKRGRDATLRSQWS